MVHIYLRHSVSSFHSTDNIWYTDGSKDPSCNNSFLDFRKVGFMLYRLSSFSFICSYIYAHILIFTEHPLCSRTLSISICSPWILHSAMRGQFPKYNVISLASRPWLTLFLSPGGPFSTLLLVSFRQSLWTLWRHHQLWKVSFRRTELVLGVEKRNEGVS